ncbi:MAG: hypothetical protein AAF431_10295 [Pseudomonadota bacterium]
MSRYREDESLEGYKMAQHASDDMLLFTAVIAVVIGLIISYIGKRGKQLWMLVWGIGLVVVSIAMGVVTWLQYAG